MPSAVNTLIQFSLVPPLPANVIVAGSHTDPMPAHVASQLAPAAPRYQHEPPTAAPPFPHGVGVAVAVSVGVLVGVRVGTSAVFVGVGVAVAGLVGIAVAKFGLFSGADDEPGKQTVLPDGTTTGTLPGSHCARAVASQKSRPKEIETMSARIILTTLAKLRGQFRLCPCRSRCQSGIPP